MAVVKMIKGMHKQLIAYLSLLSFLPIAAAAKRRKLRRREGETIISFVVGQSRLLFLLLRHSATSVNGKGAQTSC